MNLPRARARGAKSFPKSLNNNNNDDDVGIGKGGGEGGRRRVKLFHSLDAKTADKKITDEKSLKRIIIVIS
jgi:hypothetical protein